MRSPPVCINAGHAGDTATGMRKRLTATLKAGTKTIRIAAGSSFFLSVTDSNSW